MIIVKLYMFQGVNLEHFPMALLYWNGCSHNGDMLPIYDCPTVPSIAVACIGSHHPSSPIDLPNNDPILHHFYRNSGYCPSTSTISFVLKLTKPQLEHAVMILRHSGSKTQRCSRNQVNSCKNSLEIEWANIEYLSYLLTRKPHPTINIRRKYNRTL